MGNKYVLCTISNLHIFVENASVAFVKRCAKILCSSCTFQTSNDILSCVFVVQLGIEAIKDQFHKCHIFTCLYETVINCACCLQFYFIIQILLFNKHVSENVLYRGIIQFFNCLQVISLTTLN